jgi:hypothetical protein
MVSPLLINAANLGRGLPSGVAQWYSQVHCIISLPTVQMPFALSAAALVSRPPSCSTIGGSAIDESSTERV